MADLGRLLITTLLLVCFQVSADSTRVPSSYSIETRPDAVMADKLDSLCYAEFSYYEMEILEYRGIEVNFKSLPPIGDNLVWYMDEEGQFGRAYVLPLISSDDGWVKHIKESVLSADQFLRAYVFTEQPQVNDYYQRMAKGLSRKKYFVGFQYPVGYAKGARETVVKSCADDIQGDRLLIYLIGIGGFIVSLYGLWALLKLIRNLKRRGRERSEERKRVQAESAQQAVEEERKARLTRIAEEEAVRVAARRIAETGDQVISPGDVADQVVGDLTNKKTD